MSRELVVARPGRMRDGDIVRVPIAVDLRDGGDAVVEVRRWKIVRRDSQRDVVTGHDPRTGFVAVDPEEDWIALKPGQDFIVERVADLAREPTRMERLEQQVRDVVSDAVRERDAVAAESGHVTDSEARRINATLGDEVRTIVRELYKE